MLADAKASATGRAASSGKKANGNAQINSMVDPWVMGISLCLLLIGLVMVASSSISIADRQSGQPFYFLYRQLIAAGLGVFLGLIVFGLPLKLWEKYSPVFLAIGVVLLIAVLIPGIGKQVNGSYRWIPLGVFNLQVSELVKLVFILYLAGFLVRKQALIQNGYKGLLTPIGILALVVFLLLMEPDLGAGAVIAATALGMLFLAGAPLLMFAGLVLLALAGGIMLVVYEPYRAERLKAFLDPWADPFNSGFQLTQSLMALGRGDWLGVGLGHSVQKLFYLPEAHTDFIFAVLAEELGMLGAIAIIVLFLGLVARIFYLGQQAHLAKQAYSGYLLYGFGIWISVQAFVNIGVNMGVLPTKGLTLPLISYGGSSLMIMCVVIALILRAEYEMREKKPFDLTTMLFNKSNK